MSLGYSKEFNDATRPGFDPDAADSAMRRLKNTQDMQDQQAFYRQLSGAAEATGEIGKAAGTARQIAEDTAKADEKARKERTDRAVILASIDNARDFAAQRGRDAANLEDIFEARFGDAWREEIANRVMDPDEIPERRDGETMEEYRERLGDVLIERMIDPETGQIRPEYRDDPEMRQFADWALARYDEREARSYVSRRSDPALSADARDELDRNWLGSATEERMQLASQEAARNGQNIEPVAEAIDNERNDVATSTSTQAGLDAFL